MHSNLQRVAESFVLNSMMRQKSVYTLPAYKDRPYYFYDVNLRTVPPFYDSTTHREDYVWKYPIPDIYEGDYYNDQYRSQADLPAFEGETTNRATYRQFELVTPSR